MVATEVTAEVTTPKVTLKQQEHDKEISSEKDKETQVEVTHTETQEVIPSESPAVEQVCYTYIYIVLKIILFPYMVTKMVAMGYYCHFSPNTVAQNWLLRAN